MVKNYDTKICIKFNVDLSTCMYGFVGEYSSSDSDSDESVPLATTIET